MLDSDSDDELRPHQLARRQFGLRFFSDSDDDEEVRDYNPDGASLASSLCSRVRDDIDDDSAAAAPALNHENRFKEASNLDGATPNSRGKSLPNSLLNNKPIWERTLLPTKADQLQIISYTIEMFICSLLTSSTVETTVAFCNCRRRCFEFVSANKEAQQQRTTLGSGRLIPTVATQFGMRQ
jgi:hypothetical protein